MKFLVLDRQTLQCVLSAKEIEDFGMNRKRLLKNDDKVREFFAKIMKRAEAETGFRKDPGDVAVQASFRPDESVEILFCVGVEQAEEHRIEFESGEKPKGLRTAVFKCRSLMDMVSFCKHAIIHPEAMLYQYRGIYYLLADVCDYTTKQVALLFHLADEYMETVCYNQGIASYLEEHGECILMDNAVETLCSI